MASGADIPPELFERILYDVCEGARRLLNPMSEVPIRKQALKNVTACSLTCVYWAHICRQELFRSVWVKNYEDMRRFASLVSSTPHRLQPISHYVYRATLEQRIGDRPWIHLLRMQPSLLKLLFPKNTSISIVIKDYDSTGGAAALQSQWSTSRRLFIALPRTLPSLALQCSNLTVNNARVVIPHDLTSLVGRLISPSTNQPHALMLRNVRWDSQAPFESYLLTSDPLEIPENCYFIVTVQSSHHTAQVAWLAFATRFRTRRRNISQLSIFPTLNHDLEKKSPVIMRILSPAQRAILEICALLLRVTELSGLDLSHRSNYDEPEHVFLSKGAVADVKEICGILTSVVEPGAPDRFLSLRFCYIDLVGYSGPILTVEHISVLCIRVYTVPTKTASVPGDPSTRMQDVFTPFTAYPLEEIAQRAALSKLDGRIRLFYQTDDSLPIVATDFETLNELPGDARTEHGYIDH